ncbi:uncharacterized protein [Salminus brasiliensis]|uniref:uncharacterized protein isoform X1 n=1 Tax=Salminus brasiliensis TaxID=930266 RepID=UPI003B82D00D
MILAKIIKFFGQHPFSSNVLFGIILTGLEKIIENDFICPCKSGYTEAIFWLYLLTPTVASFIFGLYLQHCAKLDKTCCLNFFSSFIPPIVWLALFFLDGRYMSCLKTTIKVDYDDSDEKPPWKWCHKNQTLTDDQIHAWRWFFISRLIGLGIFIFILILVLFYKCYKCMYQKKVLCCSAHGQTCGSAHCRNCCLKHKRTCCSEHNNIHCLAHPPRNKGSGKSASKKTDSGNTDSENQQERQPLQQLKMKSRGNTTSDVSSPCATTSDVSSPCATTSDVSSPCATTSDVGSPCATTSDVGSPCATTSDVGSPCAKISDVGSPCAKISNVGSPCAKTNTCSCLCHQTCDCKCHKPKPSLPPH